MLELEEVVCQDNVNLIETAAEIKKNSTSNVYACKPDKELWNNIRHMSSTMPENDNLMITDNLLPIYQTYS